LILTCLKGSKWGDHCAINRWVEQHLDPHRPAFVVHRLDRFASGLILIAHRKKTATLLADLFKEKRINKQYKVIVHGEFPNETVTYRNEIDNKPAISHVSLLQYDDINNQSLVQVDIETGRKHQIRLHLSEAGFPVVGDRLFGDEDIDIDIDLQLTAFKLSFTSPIDESEKIYVLDTELQPKL
jgi:tRNA pseudouridine32 synthase/23S rRNA pseudouridine746 synthase